MSDTAQSPEAVALQLTFVVNTYESNPPRTREEFLALYADCLKAAKGNYKNQSAAPAAKKAPRLAS